MQTLTNEILVKRTDLAKIVLLEGWKLKSKFKFTLHNPPRETQDKFIRADRELLLSQYFAFLKAFKKDTFVLPFEKIPLPTLKAKLLNGKSDKKFIDLSFLPRRASVYDPSLENPFDIVVHWRRPTEFMITDYRLDLHQPAVFYNSVEPVDIKPGVLGDDWFLSALAILAERPALIERLFLTRHVNEIGIYRVKLCKNGEWQIVTIDDFFPCYPQGEPLFSCCLTNDLFVLILEKAYAKLHGGYY